MATKTYKKFLTGAATAAMVASAVAPVAAQGQDVAETANQSFTDIGPNSSHFLNVTEARELGFLSGYDDGTFKPNKILNRGDVTKMLGKYVIATSGKTLSEYVEENKIADVENFTDVPNDARDKELVTYSKIVKKAGIFEGSNNNLMPTKEMNRDQIAAVLVRAFDLKDDTSKDTKVIDGENSGYVKQIEILLENGVSDANPYKPFNKTSRAQFASFLVRAYKVSQGWNPGEELPEIEAVNKVNDITIKVGETPTLPTTVGVMYNNGSTGTANVTWDTSKLDNSKAGTYTLTGDVARTDIDASVKVIVEADELGDVTEAAITTTVIDDDTPGQSIAFTVNGRIVSVNDLVNVHGYDVEFQADRNVFAVKDAAATNTSESGVIDANAPAVKVNEEFEVKIVLTRDGEVVQSDEATVKVVNLNATPTIGDLAVENVTEGQTAYTLKSNTLVIGEKYDIPGIVSESGQTIDVSGPVVYSSSKPAVALVDRDSGEITPVSPGTVTITATAGDQTTSVELTVTNDQRELATAAVNNDSLKLAQEAERTVGVTVTDQYGDPFNFDANDIEVTLSKNAPLTVSGTVVPSNTVAGAGSINVEVNEDATAGTYQLYLRAEDFTSPLDTVNVQVTADNTVAPKNSKLELSPTPTSGVIATLNINEYTRDGGFVQKADASVARNAGVVTVTSDPVKDDAGNTYTVSVADPRVAEVFAENDGDIIVKAGQRDGQTDIVLSRNGVVVDTYKVTVTTPVTEVTAVEFVEIPTVVAAGETIETSDVLNIQEVTTPDVDDIVRGLSLNVTTSAFARINDEGLIYLDNDDSGDLTAKDVELGNVLLDSSDLDVEGSSYTTVAGDEGTLVFSFVKSGDDPREVLAATTVKVDVPTSTIPVDEEENDDADA